MNKNIFLYYIFEFLTSAQFYGPIFAIFFQSFSLSQTQIVSFLSIYAISTITFEIPTGILSDYIGRKRTLIIASFLSMISFFIFAFGDRYLHFVLAYLIMGLGGSFRSGTDEAFLYDTLLDLKLKDKFKQIKGRAGFISNFGIIIGMALGGFLFAADKRLPYLITAICVGLSLLTALFFIEPKKEKTDKSILQHTFLSFKLFHTNRQLLSLAIFSVLTIGAIVVSFFLVQQYYSILGIPVYFIGLVIVISKLLESLSGKYAYKIENLLKEKFSLIIIAALVVTGYSLMYFFNFYWAFISSYFLSIAMGIHGPILSDCSN